MTTVFTKNGCIQCRFTKQWLDAHHIDYQIINIDQDAKQKNYLIKQGIQSLPAIFVNGQFAFTGFAPSKLAKTF